MFWQYQLVDSNCSLYQPASGCPWSEASLLFLANSIWNFCWPIPRHQSSYSHMEIGMEPIASETHSIWVSLPFPGGDWIPRVFDWQKTSFHWAYVDKGLIRPTNRQPQGGFWGWHHGLAQSTDIYKPKEKPSALFGVKSNRQLKLTPGSSVIEWLNSCQCPNKENKYVCLSCFEPIIFHYLKKLYEKHPGTLTKKRNSIFWNKMVRNNAKQMVHGPLKFQEWIFWKSAPWFFRTWKLMHFQVSKLLTSWRLNQPLWKICSSKWVHLRQFSGWKFQKYLSCHHPMVHFGGRCK